MRRTLAPSALTSGLGRRSICRAGKSSELLVVIFVKKRVDPDVLKTDCYRGDL